MGMESFFPTIEKCFLTARSNQVHCFIMPCQH